MLSQEELLMRASELGYDITKLGLAVIPRAIRDMKIQRVFVDFLRPYAHEAKNTITIKVDFESEYNEYQSVRIWMEFRSQIPPSEERYRPASLIVAPCDFRGVSTSAIRACPLKCKPDIVVVDLLQTLMKHEMQYFDFIGLDGCRDFVTQAVYQFREAGYVETSIDKSPWIEAGFPVSDAFAAMGLRFQGEPRGLPFACPIDAGRFGKYTRVVTSAMPYVGTWRARELEEEQLEWE